MLSRVLDREKYTRTELNKVELCLSTLRGRPPTDVTCISGGFYRHRLEGVEGPSGPVIKVHLSPLDTGPETEGAGGSGGGGCGAETASSPCGVRWEFVVPVPGLYGYGVRFLAINDTHLLLQTFSNTIQTATATALYDIASGTGRSVDDISDMTEYVASPGAQFFLCRDHIYKPSAGWLWWAHTGQRQLIEMTSFQERPERLLIDPRPSADPAIYYITCSKHHNQGYLTRYDTGTGSPRIQDNITLSTEVLMFSADRSCLLAVQRYPVNFVSVHPDTLSLQRSICYHHYSPLDGLPLSFPPAVWAYLGSAVQRGLQAPLVVPLHSPICGLQVASESCVVLIPVFEATGDGVAIVHLNMADTGMAPKISRVDLYSLSGGKNFMFADDPVNKSTDHNHNVKAGTEIHDEKHRGKRGEMNGDIHVLEGDDDTEQLKSSSADAADDVWRVGVRRDHIVPDRFKKLALCGFRSNSVEKD